MSERDTQFKGFAEKLYQEIQAMACSYRTAPSPQELKRRECEITARRAYDLVQHAIVHSGILEQDWRLTTEAVMNAIPDLTELPKESE